MPEKLNFRETCTLDYKGYSGTSDFRSLSFWVSFRAWGVHEVVNYLLSLKVWGVACCLRVLCHCCYDYVACGVTCVFGWRHRVCRWGRIEGLWGFRFSHLGLWVCSLTAAGLECMYHKEYPPSLWVLLKPLEPATWEFPKTRGTRFWLGVPYFGFL